MGSINPKEKKAQNKVRTLKYKRKTFDKGYTPNWTEEIFVVNKIQPTKPITCKLVDLMVEKYQVAFIKKNAKNKSGNI